MCSNTVQMACDVDNRTSHAWTRAGRQRELEPGQASTSRRKTGSLSPGPEGSPQRLPDPEAGQRSSRACVLTTLWAEEQRTAGKRTKKTISEGGVTGEHSTQDGADIGRNF